jgi:hypothetical protein
MTGSVFPIPGTSTSHPEAHLIQEIGIEPLYRETRDYTTRKNLEEY